MTDAERRLLEMVLRETPEAVAGLLGELDRRLRQHRPAYHALLQPGLSPSSLDRFEQAFGLALPVSFRMLYQWRNGQRPDCSASLENNRMFMSLAEVTDTKRMLDGMIGKDFEDPNWWRKEWVPFLSNSGGGYLCVDLRTADGEIPPRVIAFWHDGEARPVEHPSLTIWLDRLVGSMQDGTDEVV
jgi:cell wall assembly regulator SMI1